MPDLADIRTAWDRIADGIVRTPCRPSPMFEDELACTLYFKFENLQRTGSFKARGARNRLLQMSADERARGVITASAGNHAQAVAFHAAQLGIPARVVMPETTPFIKIANTKRYGAEVVLHGQTFSSALEEAWRLEARENLVMIHAYDDDAVIAGQGTIGLELLEQVPDLETVIVPIGGGGLISGTAIALKESRPGVRVIGVEAEAAASARASRDAGRIVAIEQAETIAEGIAIKQVGELTFPLIERYVDDIVVVSEEEIASAILQLLEREKTVVEGAGAAPLAALLSGRVPVQESEVVVAVLCGGNIDVNRVSRIIDRGLVVDGRVARLMVTVRDRPGALALLTELVAQHGANIIETAHRRSFADISVGDVQIVMHMEARGRDHVGEIISALEERGLTVTEAT